MNTDKLSRRRLLSGFLAGLAAWLCPRPRRAAAATPRRLALPTTLPTSPFVHSVTYTYDGLGRLTRVTEHPSRPLESIPCTHVAHEQGGTFTYYYDGLGDAGNGTHGQEAT